MMKRKFLAVILPIIGCATVVGSGFAAWYFNDDVVNGDGGSTSIGINVTEEVKASKGSLEIDLGDTTIDGVENNGRLVLDQGGARNNSVNSGIMFGDDTSTVTTATGATTPAGNKVWAFTVSYDGAAGGTGAPLTIDEIYDAGLRIRVEMTVTIDSTLNKYIDYQADLPEFNVTSEGLVTSPTKVSFDEPDVGSDPTVRTANYIVDTTKLGDSAIDQLDLNFSLDLNTEKKPVEDEDAPDGTRIDYSNNLFVYKQNETSGKDYIGGKPETGHQLAKMKRQISSSSVVFSVVAHIEDDPTR